MPVILEDLSEGHVWRVTCGGKRIEATNTITDCGGEYQGHKFVLYLEHQGIVQCFTAHDTPQHNGIAKWLNHTILEWVCALLHASGLLKYLWGKAACHVIWLKNWTPTKVLDGLTPFEVAFGTKPNLNCIHDVGARGYLCSQNRFPLIFRIPPIAVQDPIVSRVNLMSIQDLTIHTRLVLP